jgi:hypothetical protein
VRRHLFLDAKVFDRRHRECGHQGLIFFAR